MPEKRTLEQLRNIYNGKIIILKETNPRIYKGAKIRYCDAKCFCGNIWNTQLLQLVSGKIMSCGCINKTRDRTGIKNPNYRHGLRNNRFRGIRNHIQQRTSNPNRKDYNHYGGRGIKCLRERFEDFRDDMYDSYLKHIEEFGEKNTELDRINNELNYSKVNCRWATRKEQCNNKRCSKRLFFDGKNLTISEWSIVTGIGYGTIQSRIRYGRTPEQILTVNVDRDEYYINYKTKKTM